MFICNQPRRRARPKRSIFSDDSFIHTYIFMAFLAIKRKITCTGVAVDGKDTDVCAHHQIYCVHYSRQRLRVVGVVSFLNNAL